MRLGRKSRRGAPGRLRIIGGAWRGRRLAFPGRADVRPTPDRVRETLFNWLAHELPGARCLDLFAGTGALGLEALSRGAAEAWLVERDATLASALERHVRELGAEARVVHGEARRFLARPPAGPYDVVFLDPPYREPIEPFLDAVVPLLAPGALVYVERALPPGLPDPPHGAWIKRGRAGGMEFGLLGLGG